MQREGFIRSLAVAAGLAPFVHAAPAFAAPDEAAIGREMFFQLRDDGDLLFDSPYYEHLNEVGSVIARTVKDRYPYPMQFYVIKGDSANSFSVPGGHVYVNEPLLALANNRDELGGVLAHETGHMLLHHVLRRMRNASVANTIGTILSIPAQILLGPLASIGAGYAIDTVGNAQNANLSRHIEAQADEEGARIMAASNELNPYGMIWFFEVMTKKYGDRGTFWLSDHPFSSARIADLKALFASAPQTFGKFHDSKAADDVYW